jgi:hypothetical protein
MAAYMRVPCSGVKRARRLVPEVLENAPLDSNRSSQKRCPMRSGIVICPLPNATARWQSQTAMVLSHNGFSVDLRQRYDGLMIVAFERDDDEPDFESEEILQKMLEAGDAWNEDVRFKMLK